MAGSISAKDACFACNVQTISKASFSQLMMLLHAVSPTRAILCRMQELPLGLPSTQPVEKASRFGCPPSHGTATLGNNLGGAMQLTLGLYRLHWK